MLNKWIHRGTNTRAWSFQYLFLLAATLSRVTWALLEAKETRRTHAWVIILLLIDAALSPTPPLKYVATFLAFKFIWIKILLVIFLAKQRKSYVSCILIEVVNSLQRTSSFDGYMNSLKSIPLSFYRLQSSLDNSLMKTKMLQQEKKHRHKQALRGEKELVSKTWSYKRTDKLMMLDPSLFYFIHSPIRHKCSQNLLV